MLSIKWQIHGKTLNQPLWYVCKKMQERHQELFKILTMGNILKTLHILNFYCKISDCCLGNFYFATNDCESENTFLLQTEQFLVQQSHSDGWLWWMWLLWLDCTANIFFLQGISHPFYFIYFLFLMLPSALMKWSKIKTGLYWAASLLEFHSFS